MKTARLSLPLLLVGILWASSARANSIVGAGLAYGSDIRQSGLHLGYFYEFDTTPFRAGIQTITYIPDVLRDDSGFDQRDWLLSTQLNFQWRYFSSRPTYLYLTSGLHFDYNRTTIDFEEPGRSSVTDNDFGVGAALGAGADIDIGFSGLYLEGSVVAVSGGFSQFVITAGLRFWLGDDEEIDTQKP